MAKCRVAEGVTILVYINHFPPVLSYSAFSVQCPWTDYLKVICENISPVAMRLTKSYSQLAQGCKDVKKRCWELGLLVPQDSSSPWKTLVSFKQGRVSTCPGEATDKPDTCSESR